MKNNILLLFILCSIAIQAQVQKGKASYYDDKFEGRKTSSGEIFQQAKATAAHRTLAFGTKLKVTNLKNKKQAVVIINDRGPFIRGRIIDLSKSVAKELDFLGEGVTEVEIEVINKDTASSSSLKNSSIKQEKKDVLEKVESNKKGTLVQAKKNENKKQSQKNFETKKTTPAQTSIYTGVEFFSIDTRQIEPNFYGVQIGSFREMINLMRFTAELKTTFKEDITVQSKSNNAGRVYTVILGQFSNRDSAVRFKKEVEITYEGAFIVDMTKS